MEGKDYAGVDARAALQILQFCDSYGEQNILFDMDFAYKEFGAWIAPARIYDIVKNLIERRLLEDSKLTWTGRIEKIRITDDGMNFLKGRNVERTLADIFSPIP